VLERSKKADILLTNKTPLTRDALMHLPNLKFVSVLATGYNIVDVEAAKEMGIPVSNIPVYGTSSVAQFVLALLLELCHHTGLHSQVAKNGEWAESVHWSYWKTPIIELDGKTILVIGFGRIGKRVGELAHVFGMNVLAMDTISQEPPAYEPFTFVTLDEGVSRADVISLNCSLSADNQGMVDSDFLSKMKESAFLINAARGGLVNEPDLAAALIAGDIAGAALDVVSTEPIMPENPLLAAPNCIITPHIAWASLEARQRLMHETAENIAAFQRGVPKHVVNP
jgi:glycerate dehydrogenase